MKTDGNEDMKERRDRKRIPFREHILIDDIIKCESIDISETGLYVCAVQHFEENSVIDITIPLKEEKLKVKGQVLYCQLGIGMGINFIDLNNEQRTKIQQFIKGVTEKPTEPEGIKKIILLVEDDDMSSQEQKSKLVTEGFSVVQARDGIEAIKFLAGQTPDLIVLDLYMEKMDGFKVLSILKLHPLWKEVPVVVYSVRGTQDVMQKVLDAGADEFLSKMVISPSQLAETVKAILPRR